MKKTITLLLILAFIIGISLDAGAVNATPMNSSSKSHFKYTITPSSPEWKNFSTLELKNMLNILISEAENMDTETLLNVVLDYPFLGDIFTFDDSIKAIDFLAEQFNGLGVLLKRDDLKDKLFNNYTESSDKIVKSKDSQKINNDQRLKHKYKEVLLAHPTVFNKLSKPEKDIIIINSNKVAAKIDTLSIAVEQNSTFGLEALYQTSINPSDIIRSGTVYTSKGSAISVFERQEMSDDDKQVLDEYIASAYPKTTKLRSATYKYNCHSYAWYDTSVMNYWWMDYPNKYMTDGSYTNVPLYPTASGQKIYYSTSGLEHSGIVYSPSSVSANILITSKWGKCGLYRHTTDHCPYYISGIYPSYWK